MTAPARIKQADVTRIVRGYVAAGCAAPKIILDADGRIIAIPVNDKDPDTQAPQNPWDVDLEE